MKKNRAGFIIVKTNKKEECFAQRQMKWTFAGDFPVSYLLSDLEFQSDHKLDRFLDGLGVIDSITGSPGRIRLGDLNDSLPCGNQ